MADVLLFVLNCLERSKQSRINLNDSLHFCIILASQKERLFHYLTVGTNCWIILDFGPAVTYSRKVELVSGYLFCNV